MTMRQTTIYWLLSSLIFLLMNVTSDAQALRYRVSFTLTELQAANITEDNRYDDKADELLVQLGVATLTSADRIDADSLRWHTEVGPFLMRRNYVANDLSTMSVHHTADEPLVLLFALFEDDRSELDNSDIVSDGACLLWGGLWCDVANLRDAADFVTDDAVMIAYETLLVTPDDLAWLADQEAFALDLVFEGDEGSNGFRYPFTVTIQVEEL